MRGTSVLLVEDDRDHQALLSECLLRERPGVELTVASDASSFVDAVASGQFDCVLMDFNLGIHRAADVLAGAASFLRGTPVIVVSSSEDPGVVIASLRSGVTDFVPKGEAIEPGVLWKAVDLAIRRAREQRLERRREQRRRRSLERAAETDPLTGLGNRRWLDKVLADPRERGERRGSCWFMIDIDHFKVINDQHGHHTGDRVLAIVGAALRETVGSQGSAVRWGGEEFLVLADAGSPAEAWRTGDRLRRAIAHFTANANVPAVSVSIGLATATTGMSRESAIERADHALYLAKESGRNRVCTWEMVEAERVAADVQTDGGLDDRRRCEAFIRRVSPSLGATQLEHVTSHSVAVGQASRRIAGALCLGPAEESAAEIAGLVHDLGKCVIPESVLSKPGSLDSDEWEIMERHAALGADLCESLGLKGTTAEAVRNHHARYDGRVRGQPAWSRFGRTGDEPPLSAWIVSVADALVTMTSNRPYRARMGVDEARAELRRESGRQFHPAVVAAADRVAGVTAGGQASLALAA